MRPSAITRALVACLSTLAVAACADEAPPSESAYCGAVGLHAAALNSPTLATQTDVEAMVAEWQKVADVAPQAVAPEWAAVMDVLRTAASLDPNDPKALQAFADASRTNEPAANRIIEYTYSKCGATIGPVTPVPSTLVPPATAPPTTGG
jgi:hypothetical protein